MSQHESDNTGQSESVKYLWEEYKLLQDKIDKIGAFKFQIKNWVVGLVSGLVVSGNIAKLPWWSNLSCLFLIGFFWLFETLQEEFQDAYLHRVRVLEREMRSRDPGVFSALKRLKYSQIVDLRKIPPSSPAHAIYIRMLALKRHWYSRFVLSAHGWFYVVLTAIVIGVCIVTAMRDKTEDATYPIRFTTPLNVELRNRGEGQAIEK